MIMGVDNLVGLRCHGEFYTGFIFQGHQKGVAKGIVGPCFPIIGRVGTIWDELLLKLRVTFNVLVRRNKVSSDYSQ